MPSGAPTPKAQVPGAPAVPPVAKPSRPDAVSTPPARAAFEAAASAPRTSAVRTATPAVGATTAPSAAVPATASATVPAAGEAPATALATTGIENQIPLAGAGILLAFGGAAILFGQPGRRSWSPRPV